MRLQAAENDPGV